MTIDITPLFIGGLRGGQFIFIIILALILFGGVSQIPKIMRNLGKGVHSFKQGIEDAKEEMNRPVRKARDTRNDYVDEDYNDRPRRRSATDDSEDRQEQRGKDRDQGSSEKTSKED